jgi:hypothetical protein
MRWRSHNPKADAFCGLSPSRTGIIILTGRRAAWKHQQIRLILLSFASLLMAGPALAEWDCQIERSYKCDAVGKCDSEKATARVRLNDEKLQYSWCLAECEEGAVLLRRNFFGSLYRHVASDNSARTMMRSRSGEYSEHTTAPDGAVTSVAFGACAWR